MANQAAFYFLLASTCSVLLLLPRGELWGSSATSLLQKRPTFANVSSGGLRFRGWHTHHTPFPLISTASIIRCHLLFKPHIMPILASPSTHLPVKDFGGTAAGSGLSVTIAATGFSTDSSFLSKKSLALKLQHLHTHPWRLPNSLWRPLPHQDSTDCRAKGPEGSQGQSSGGEEACCPCP